MPRRKHKMTNQQNPTPGSKTCQLVVLRINYDAFLVTLKGECTVAAFVNNQIIIKDTSKGRLEKPLYIRISSLRFH
jgi:hypothetical protein